MVAMFADATKDFSLTAMENPAQVTFTQVAVQNNTQGVFFTTMNPVKHQYELFLRKYSQVENC